MTFWKNPAPGPWTVVDSKVSFQDRWLTVRSDDCRTETGVSVAPYHVLEYPDWVCVLPVLADGTVMLVKEYRHGIGKVVTGLVSGSVEPYENTLEGDACLDAATRELREETGYTAAFFVKTLVSYPNAASHTNQISH